MLQRFGQRCRREVRNKHHEAPPAKRIAAMLRDAAKASQSAKLVARGDRQHGVNATPEP
jgi:hypothetical protein